MLKPYPKLSHALLTGGTSGLGMALVPLLLEDGMEVTVLARSEHRFKTLKAGLDPNYRDRLHCLIADLSDNAGLSSAVKALDPKTDLLINCAATAATGPIEEIPVEEVERILQIDFVAAVQLIKSILPEMKKNKKGVIVNVSSGVARRPLPFTLAYCSAKAALNAFTEGLRVELANTGVDVLLFSPGPVTSRFHENIIHFGDSPLQSPKFYGEPPEKIAAKLFHAIKKRKSNTILGFKANLACHLQYWAPGWTEKLVSRLYTLKLTD